MACRIGMATNVAERVRELKSAGIVPAHATVRELDRGLYYEQAQIRERQLIAACGIGCDGAPGGRIVPGPVWSVYRLDW